MHKQSEMYDVLVIGGGPGGSSAATMLARQGRRVLVLERERFPRHHVGESLLLGVLRLLRVLGVAEKVEQSGFVHKRGSTHVWGDSFTPWTLYFNEAAPQKTHSYQVERSAFDKVLLDHAESCGADVWRGVNVADVRLDTPGEVAVSYRDGEGESGVVRGAFLIDASGQRRFMAKQMHVAATDYDPFFRNMAVYRYFRGGGLLDGIDRSNLFLEAFPRGWFWHIPLHTREVSVGAVVGQDSLPCLRTAGGDRFLDQQIGDTTHMRRLLEGARAVSHARMINNFSYEVDRFAGDRFLLVGDAACFTDPMFASGVYLAILTGIQAAAILDAALERPSGSQEAFALYERQFRRLYRNAHHAAQLIYDSNDLFTGEEFWRERKLTVDQLTSQASDAGFMQELHPGGALAYERLALSRVVLSPVIEGKLRRIDAERDRRKECLQGVMQDMGRWIPLWREAVTRTEGLGYEVTDDTYRVVEGVEFDSDGAKLFLSDSCALAAMRAVDGRRSVREIINDIIAPLPEQERFGTQLQLVYRFMDGQVRGLFSAHVRS